MEQVYEPTVIADIPFPQDQPVVPTVSQTSGNQTYGQATITDTPLPNPVVAQELLSTALNTRSKKIVQQFQFAPSGALQIGDFAQGVTGDVRISPNGIVARDLSGNPTFTLDGDTGGALFAGEVREGATVTGNITVLGGGAIVLYDTTGKASIFIGQIP